MPDFVAPQLCVSVDRPPSGEGWCHEIKFDGYRVQLRVEDGDAALKTRKGLDWTDKFPAIAKQASALPDCLIDGEIVALDHNGVPDFSTLQAAISDGKTDDLIFFAFDLLFADGDGSSPRCRLASARQQLKQLLEALPKGKAGSIRYVEHFEDGGDAVLQSACKLSLEGIVSKKLELRPIVRAGPRTGPRPKCRAGQEVVLGGWKTTNGKFRSLMAGVYRDDHLAFVGIVGTGFGQDTVRRIMPALKAAASNKSPVRRQGRAAQDPRRALAEAGACRRDRIRRLDRRRQYPAGGVQGTAPGQAGRRGRGGKPAMTKLAKPVAKDQTTSGTAGQSPRRAQRTNPPR